MDIDKNMHRALHQLTVKAKAMAATYDWHRFTKHRSDVTQCDLREAAERLEDLGWIVRKAEAVFQVVMPCTCKGGPGMYAGNPDAPPHCHLENCHEHGVELPCTSSDVLDSEPVGAALRPPQEPQGAKESSSPEASGFKPDGTVQSAEGTWPGESASRSERMAFSAEPAQKKPRPTNRQPRPSDIESWSNLALAQYFSDQSKAKAWGKSMKPNNEPALAKEIRKWRNDGDSATEIKKAIDLFFKDAGSDSGVRQALWQDFIGKYHWSVDHVRKGTDRLQGEDIRYDREAWLQ